MADSFFFSGKLFLFTTENEGRGCMVRTFKTIFLVFFSSLIKAFFDHRNEGKQGRRNQGTKGNRNQPTNSAKTFTTLAEIYYHDA